jgi:hypothetical protein
VVGEVRHHISVGTISLDEHPVLVVPELGGGEPQGSLALVDVPALFEFLQKLFHGLRFVEALLAEVGVEADARAGERRLDVIYAPAGCEGADLGQRFVRGHVQIPVACFLGERPRYLVDVLAAIEILGVGDRPISIVELGVASR